jgi:hypothetical protein
MGKAGRRRKPRSLWYGVAAGSGDAAEREEEVYREAG